MIKIIIIIINHGDEGGDNKRDRERKRGTSITSLRSFEMLKLIMDRLNLVWSRVSTKYPKIN